MKHQKDFVLFLYANSALIMLHLFCSKAQKHKLFLKRNSQIISRLTSEELLSNDWQGNEIRRGAFMMQQPFKEGFESLTSRLRVLDTVTPLHTLCTSIANNHFYFSKN